MDPWTVGGGIVVLVLSLFLPAVCLRRRAAPDIIDDVDALPETSLIVLLGCPAVHRHGQPNRYFDARAEAGARVFHALDRRLVGRGASTRPRILCSGLDDLGEVTAFVDALLRLGVARDRIDLDGRARRTIDTIARVALLVPEGPVIFVSQRFHLPRVLYLASAHGFRSCGYPAEGGLHGLRSRARETLACVRAVVEARRAESPR